MQAPTGSGKTLIFELWSYNAVVNRAGRPSTRCRRELWPMTNSPSGGRAVGRGYRHRRSCRKSQRAGDRSDVGDAEESAHGWRRSDAAGRDEYQMISDPDRGLNYELPSPSLRHAEPTLAAQWQCFQSASRRAAVEPPGRQAVLVRHEHRPCRSAEVHANNLNFALFTDRGYWPRLVAKSLAEDPADLDFRAAPASAEMMAADLARTCHAESAPAFHRAKADRWRASREDVEEPYCVSSQRTKLYGAPE